MNGTFNHNSSPNPAKLIESLRYLGYDNYHAISDIVDNSVDAGAKNIRVIVRTSKGAPEIVVADDGLGMDEEILDQAIRLGSLVEKDASNDLGRFGMGLCTASLSICRQTTVLTKTVEGELLKAVNDVDEVKRLNSFVSIFGKASDEDKALFSEMLNDSPSGTLIVLRKCDNLQNRNLTQFSRILAKHLARIFRYFITAGLSLRLNDEQKLTPIDPLEWENPRTLQFDDGEVSIKINDEGNTITDVIRVKLAILPESTEGEAVIAQNYKNQGFYVLRNNREVLDAVPLDFFTKHPDFNRFRGEIHFTGTLDKYMGVNFTKRDVALHQSLFDQLNQYVQGQLKTIRSRLRKAQQAETPADVADVHKSVEQEIQRKSKLLLTPKAPKEQREPKRKRNGDKPKLEDTTQTREPREKQQPGGFAANCRFETASMGEAGVIYDAEQQGRTIIIRWNSDHPFYKRFVLENVQEKRIVAASDCLIYSLACAELMWFTNEETLELFHNLKTVMSGNMRTLLS